MTDTRIADDPDLAQPRPRGRNRWIRWAVITAAVVAGLVGAGLAIVPLVTSCDLGSDVVDRDGQCVGTTDGSFVFDPGIRSIQRKILAENERVARTAERTKTAYVTVALLMPYTADRTSAMPIERIRYSLEGAYLAQKRANNGPIVQDPEPLVALLLANEGSHQQHWPTAVDKIIKLTGGDHPVLAVAGLGVSVRETFNAADRMAQKGVPMVGAVLTASTLNYPNLIKVSASNDDYIKAIAPFIDARPDLDNAILVADKTDDPYPATLRSAFERNQSLKSRIRTREEFTGSANPGDASPALFYRITESVCASTANVVYFAGRINDLKVFIPSLANRRCGTERPLTIVTGATGLTALDAPDMQRALKAGRITVVHAASTDHGRWSAGVPGTPARYGEFLTAFRAEGFDETALWDGYAVMHHDAVITAIKAIRLAALETGRAVPRIADVRDHLHWLRAPHTSPSAGGDLSYSSEGNGWPGGRTIPLLQVPADAQPGLPDLPTYTTTPH